MNKFKQFWESLEPSARGKAIKGGVILSVVFIGLFGYFATGQDEKRNIRVEGKETPIRLGDELAEDDIRKQIETDRERQQEHNNVISGQVTDLKGGLDQLNKTLLQLNESKSIKAGQGLTEVESNFKYPPPVPDASGSSLEEIEPVYVGGISHTEGTQLEKNDETKKKSSLYLAPGFMDGMLLTGLRADTVVDANEDPEPMLIRIQAPAILPNHIKANLKGCFVVANGFGKLNKERVEARLVSLHCVNQKEEAVIDEKIKGFIADEDGTKGLNGRVVTKAGANVARVFVAGFFGGAGEAIKSASTSTSISALGAVESIPTGEEAFRRGMGQGLSDASNDIRKVFLDLVRQSSPVIEVGPTKKVSVVLIEGVNLQIRDINNFELASNSLSR